MQIQTDNSLMSLVNYYDKGKAVEKDGKLLSIPDIAMNWTKNSSVSGSTRIAALQKEAEDCAKIKMTASQIEEVLLSQGYSEAEIKQAFGSRTASKVSKVFPESYDDVRERVHEIALTCSAREFFDLVTARSNPMIGMLRVANKNSDNVFQLIRAFQSRSKDQRIADEFDNMMRKSVDEEIERSVLAAVVKEQNVRYAKTKEHDTYIIKDEDEQHRVNLISKSCECDRFVQGNLGAFGIPCEHIILAHRALTSDGQVEVAEENVRRKFS